MLSSKNQLLQNTHKYNSKSNTWGFSSSVVVNGRIYYNGTKTRYTQDDDVAYMAHNFSRLSKIAHEKCAFIRSWFKKRQTHAQCVFLEEYRARVLNNLHNDYHRSSLRILSCLSIYS